MIVISAAAVAIAILLLVVGMITSNLVFVYVSIGVSVAAAILLAAGVFRRRELFVREARPQTGAAPDAAVGATAGATAATGGAAPSARAVDGLTADARSADVRSADVRSGSPQVATAGERTPSDDLAAAERTSARVLAGAGQGAFRTSRSGAAPAPPDSDVVLVVPGRRRFHVPGCIRLTGRLTEELTVNEAVEEGFTACATCLPGSVPGAWTAARMRMQLSPRPVPNQWRGPPRWPCRRPRTPASLRRSPLGVSRWSRSRPAPRIRWRRNLPSPSP